MRSVDGKVLGASGQANGAPGPVTQRMSEMYWALHDDPAHMTPIDYGLADGAAADCPLDLS